jgi:NTP pyrophosphatase (non-canonical NTP hydrolase)
LQAGFVLRSTFEVLSDELWQKLRKKFPERDVLVEIVKVVEELGELADLTLRINRKQREQKIAVLSGDLRTKIGNEISDVIITLVILGKDLNIDVWKMLEEKMTRERDRPL